MRPRIFETIALATLGLAAPATAADGLKPIAPDAVEGLLAWYDARSLYDKLRDREPVQQWPDSSGNGHDLTEEGGGLGSVFRTLQAGDKPAIQVGKGSTYAVAAPFALEDHTIFVVYRSAEPTVGLFSAARNDQFGVVLAKDGTLHLIQAGTNRSPYNTASAGPLGSAGFSITVLEREEGRLHAWVDGRDVSGEGNDTTPLEVGRLFRVAFSRAVSRDATGLRLADLIFYGRRLTDAERRGVTAHLAEKYTVELAEATAPPGEGIPAFDWSNAEPQASLTTSSEANLNVAGLAITWDAPAQLTAPFRFDPAHPTRLICDRDARVHLSVRLWLRTSAPDARLRLLVLHNEDDYRMADEAVTRPDPDEAAGTRLVGRLDASLAMSAGDWVEVVVARDGAAAVVTPLAGESVILAVAE